ncbi:hypothetical protein IMCC14465_13930 [alpha proteobacterium IMCC14465]|uniref:HTH lysR-type domain-containing protein n=1 Tax=alpha proteobacterium IMCC14465 TaxID=1220535 RepID=J9DX69_9PROT|nr:hypothetical protein IMCC14465_13930 [alpha proteobacterium IMCC14465]
MRRLDWDDLRFFLSVASNGTLSAAARELTVNTTTVLRRIASLEEALSARLFDRMRSGYHLTQEGLVLQELLGPVDQRLSSLQRDFQAAHAGAKGRVKVSAAETITDAVLAGGMPEFADNYPDIEVSLMHEIPQLQGISALNAGLRDVDLAIRTARPTQGDMLVRKLGDLAFGLYAHKDRAATLNEGVEITSPEALADEPLIGFDEEALPTGPVWFLSRVEKSMKLVTRAAGDRARLQMVKENLGVSALPCIIADIDPELQKIAGSEMVGSLELWLLARRDLAQFPHVRTVMDFVISRVRDLRPSLSGNTGS